MMRTKVVPRTSAVELFGPVTLNLARPTRRWTLFHVLPADWAKLVWYSDPWWVSVLTVIVVFESSRVIDPSPNRIAAAVAAPVLTWSPPLSPWPERTGEKVFEPAGARWAVPL